MYFWIKKIALISLFSLLFSNQIVALNEMGVVEISSNNIRDHNQNQRFNSPLNCAYEHLILQNNVEGTLISENQKVSITNRKLKFILYVIITFTCLLLLIICVQYKKNIAFRLAKNKAVDLSQSKTRFFSTMTHELRNPLHVVIGVTDLLINENPRENQTEYLSALKFSTAQLFALIDDVLLMGKMNNNKLEVEYLSFDLKQLIHDLLAALKLSKLNNGNTLHLILDENIPNTVKGDSLKISQVLINLIGNALKFTTDGNVWVQISVVNTTNDTITIHFNIRDDGFGISQKMQKCIFEEFTQESIEVGKKYGGTGLGLTIVKKILNLLGSEIKVESKKNEGATFYFNLTFNMTLTKNQIEKVDLGDFEGLNGIKALIVDDDKINQLLTQKILEYMQVDCTTSSSGTDAIYELQTKDFDIVLMDVNMPKINGYQTVRRIRMFNTTIPILALTANHKIDANFKGSGMNDYIAKPFLNEEFYKKIIEVLNNK